MEAHQKLGRRAGGATHLDAARSVGRRKPGLRPGRVVAVDEGAFRTVDGDGLGIGGEACHADLELLGLLAGALKERTGAADGGADAAGQRVRPGIPRDPHGRFDLVEPQGNGDGRVSAQLQWIVLGVGDMGLITRCLAGAHLGVGEGDLHRVELGHDLCQLRGCHASRQTRQLLARHVHVDEHPRHLGRRQGHGFFGDGQVEVMLRDEGVDHVEIGYRDSIHLGERPGLDGHAGRGVASA